MSITARPNLPHPVLDPVPKPVPRRPYASPAVVCELKLETRAGSALGVDPWFDPLSGLFLKGLGGE